VERLAEHWLLDVAESGFEGVTTRIAEERRHFARTTISLLNPAPLLTTRS